jgi:hypothetical protein
MKNMLYNCWKTYVHDEDELNNQLTLFKKIEDLMNGGRMKIFHTIIQNENNEDNKNEKTKTKEKNQRKKD